MINHFEDTKSIRNSFRRSGAYFQEGASPRPTRKVRREQFFSGSRVNNGYGRDETTQKHFMTLGHFSSPFPIGKSFPAIE